MQVVEQEHACFNYVGLGYTNIYVCPQFAKQIRKKLIIGIFSPIRHLRNEQG